VKIEPEPSYELARHMQGIMREKEPIGPGASGSNERGRREEKETNDITKLLNVRSHHPSLLTQQANNDSQFRS